MAYFCDLCGGRIQQGQNAYNQTNRTTGEVLNLCGDCFALETGVRPETYFGRKYGLYALFAGIILSLYMFFAVGFWGGVITGVIVYFIVKALTNR